MRFHRPFAVALVAAALAAAPVAGAQDKGGGLGGGLAAGKDEKEKLPNDPKEPLHVRVNQAIDSGVAWLKKQTFAPGNWNDEVKGSTKYDPNAKGEDYRHPAGCTALSLYTLLKCGVPADDPAIVKGFQWLKGNAGSMKGKGKGAGGGAVPRGSYEISATILALEAKANPHKREKEREREQKFRLKKGEKLKAGVKLSPDDEKWMRDLVAALVKRCGPAWRYNLDMGDGKFQPGPHGRNNDMSSTQLAMLALLAAERCGISQSDQFYISMMGWVLQQQQETGEKVRRFKPGVKPGENPAEDDRYAQELDEARGWAYIKLKPEENDKDPHREGNVTTSMTACGLANVLICAGILQARENKDFDSLHADRAEKAWHDGNAWFQEHWNIADNVNNSGTNHYHYYALYCLERVGDLKRVNLIGGHPWYDEGARLLVDEQLGDGRWEKHDTHLPRDVLNTCFALLFLNRATPAITAD